MLFCREFFDLQWQFATRAAVLARVRVNEALLDYPSFYARFGLGRDSTRRIRPWRDLCRGPDPVFCILRLDLRCATLRPSHPAALP